MVSYTIRIKSSFLSCPARHCESWTLLPFLTSPSIILVFPLITVFQPRGLHVPQAHQAWFPSPGLCTCCFLYLLLVACLAASHSHRAAMYGCTWSSREVGADSPNQALARRCLEQEEPSTDSTDDGQTTCLQCCVRSEGAAFSNQYYFLGLRRKENWKSLETHFTRLM